MPLSLMAAALVLRQVGATINTMVLAGLIIALGEIVDDAIIDVENILRRLREARRAGSDRPTAGLILEASLEVRSSIVHATLISLAAMTPVFLLHGLTAAFFRPLALAYVLAILASMLVALTVTPALTLLLLRRAPLKREASPLVELAAPRLHHDAVAHRRAAGRRLRHLRRGRPGGRPRRASPRRVAVSRAFKPARPADPLGRHSGYLRRRGHSAPRPGSAANSAEIPGVTSFGAHIGRAKQGEEVVGVNAAEVWIHIDKSVDYDRTVAAVRDVVDGYPGLYRDVETYLNERIEEVISGAKEAIVVQRLRPGPRRDAQ